MSCQFCEQVEALSKEQLVTMMQCVHAALAARFPGSLQFIEPGDTVADIARKREISKAVIENPSGATQ